MKIKFEPKFVKTSDNHGYKLTISGLKGGHSGAEIDKNLGNSIKILSCLLKSFKDVKLESFESGNQFNFIPNFATATFCGVKTKNFDNEILKLKNSYPLLQIKCEEITIDNVLEQNQTNNVLTFLDKIQSGVLKSNSFGLLLSQNLAFISTKEGLIKISQRGSDINLENENINYNNTLASSLGFTFEIFDKKPGFKTNPDCKLVKDLIKQSFLTNKIILQRKVKHVSLEECVFQTKMPNCEMVVVSPKIEFPHSTKERVFLPSIEKTYNLITNYLKSL